MFETMSSRLLTKLNKFTSQLNIVLNKNRTFCIYSSKFNANLNDLSDSNSTTKKNIDTNDLKFQESIVIKEDFIKECEENELLSEIG